MNIRSAKTSVAIVLSIVFCSACIIETGGSRAGTDSRRFQCQELTELVASQEKMYLRGVFGSGSLVYASADSCHSLLERPIASAWKTKDVFSCVVGFRCLNNDTFESDF